MKSVSLLKDSKPEYLIPDAAIRASPKLAPTVMAGVLISLPVTSSTICIHKSFLTSPERKAPQATREYAAHRLDTVLDKFLKTMRTTATRLQEKLLKPEVRQKGKEQVKEKARDSVLQLLSRLQAEQAQNKPAAQPRTQEGHSEI